MMKKIIKYLAIFIGALILLAVIFSGEDEKQNFTANKPEVEIPIYTKLSDEIKAHEIIMEKNFFLGSLDNHRVFFETTNKSIGLIIEGENSMIDSTINKAKEFKQLLIKSQKALFPKIRKEYFEITKDKLWENDIKLKSSGKGNTNLHLEGGVFAANQNKKSFQEGISSTMYDYRFKRVYYKWYEYDEDEVYYTINSKNDDEL